MSRLILLAALSLNAYGKDAKHGQAQEVGLDSCGQIIAEIDRACEEEPKGAASEKQARDRFVAAGKRLSQCLASAGVKDADSFRALQFEDWLDNKDPRVKLPGILEELDERLACENHDYDRDAWARKAKRRSDEEISAMPAGSAEKAFLSELAARETTSGPVTQASLAALRSLPETRFRETSAFPLQNICVTRERAQRSYQILRPTMGSRAASLSAFMKSQLSCPQGKYNAGAFPSVGELRTALDPLLAIADQLQDPSAQLKIGRDLHGAMARVQIARLQHAEIVNRYSFPEKASRQLGDQRGHMKPWAEGMVERHFAHVAKGHAIAKIPRLRWGGQEPLVSSKVSGNGTIEVLLPGVCESRDFDSRSPEVWETDAKGEATRILKPNEGWHYEALRAGNRTEDLPNGLYHRNSITVEKDEMFTRAVLRITAADLKKTNAATVYQLRIWCAGVLQTYNVRVPPNPPAVEKVLSPESPKYEEYRRDGVVRGLVISGAATRKPEGWTDKLKEDGFQCKQTPLEGDATASLLADLGDTRNAVDYVVRNVHSNGYSHDSGAFRLATHTKRFVCTRPKGTQHKSDQEVIVYGPDIKKPEGDGFSVPYSKFFAALKQPGRATEMLMAVFSCSSLSKTAFEMNTLRNEKYLTFMATQQASGFFNSVCLPELEVGPALLDAMVQERDPSYAKIEAEYPIFKHEGILHPGLKEYSATMSNAIASLSVVEPVTSTSLPLVRDIAQLTRDYQELGHPSLPLLEAGAHELSTPEVLAALGGDKQKLAAMTKMIRASQDFIVERAINVEENLQLLRLLTTHPHAEIAMRAAATLSTSRQARELGPELAAIGDRWDMAHQLAKDSNPELALRMQVTALLTKKWGSYDHKLLTSLYWGDTVPPDLKRAIARDELRNSDAENGVSAIFGLTSIKESTIGDVDMIIATSRNTRNGGVLRAARATLGELYRRHPHLQKEVMKRKPGLTDGFTGAMNYLHAGLPLGPEERRAIVSSATTPDEISQLGTYALNDGSLGFKLFPQLAARFESLPKSSELRGPLWTAIVNLVPYEHYMRVARLHAPKVDGLKEYADAVAKWTTAYGWPEQTWKPLLTVLQTNVEIWGSTQGFPNGKDQWKLSDSAANEALALEPFSLETNGAN